MTSANMPSPRRYWPIALLAAIAVLAALMPVSWLRAFDWVGYAVCHRIPARTFFVDGTQLPVCARDTGMYLGALLGMIYFAVTLPDRAGYYPGGRYLIVFALFFAAWGFDGFNSYLLLLRGEVFLYEPQNWLRLATGTLMGITLSTFAVALFNQGIWADASESATVRSPRTLLALLLLAAGIVAVVLWKPSWLLGPLAALSAGGVLTLLTIVNAMLLAIMRRQHGKMRAWRELLPYLAAGVALSVLEISVIAGLRLTLLPSIGGQL